MIISLSQHSKAEGIERISCNQHMQVIFYARYMDFEGYDSFYGYHSTLDLGGLGALSDIALIRFPSMSSYWG
jgi:hypothetical protein